MLCQRNPQIATRLGFLVQIAMSMGKPMQSETRLVVAGRETQKAVAVSNGGSTAIVEYTPPVLQEEEEDLEVKLRRILENVPIRVSNTSGSSAGSGSGDFHQYRQMRRREQDRLARMEVDYQKRKQLAEFSMRREEKLKTAEEKTAKKRLKRQKKKQRKKEKKKSKPNCEGGEQQQQHKEDISSDDDEGGSGNEDGTAE
ncbi:PREDICTED: PRKR-interacting protein 1-like [Tarenaya hassleriana]|uniref:PRKR-interacting protein 1-like n=1 Tax=Tarenaya hassleriana TaxID=28532 RepID=UPI00053C9BD7|nr:PREDICTED: PRKR-interacting protein 1-like [Tarenaya hassleriana]